MRDEARTEPHLSSSRVWSAGGTGERAWQTRGMRTRLVTAAALFVAIATVAGCGGDDAPAAVAVTTSTIRMTPITAAPETLPPVTAAPSTTAAPTSTAAPTTTEAAPTATDEASTTSTTVSPAVALVLRDDGLGDADFGDDPDSVIQYVNSIVGAPTADSGWADPLESFGVCPGSEVRGVTWGDLQLLFSDESVVASGRRHFFNYVYGPAYGTSITPAGMRTAEGIGVGTKVADLRAAYPDVQVYPEEIYGPYFVVNGNLSGFLTGVTDSDTIISFIGGIGCGE
ncbi:MAG: hypothetical protein JWN99_1115 [Ilumatobacteraceae bacterium]|nr:hypothetical protein [Ilumatobacteraceae bacterium]